MLASIQDKNIMLLPSSNIKVIDLKNQIASEYFKRTTSLRILFEEKYELSDNFILRDCLTDLSKISVMATDNLECSNKRKKKQKKKGKVADPNYQFNIIPEKEVED